MTDMEHRVISDGRRLDVLLSEATGLSRSRVASLMEEGLCLSGGKECRKAGTKLPEGQEIVLTVPAPREAVPQAEDIPLQILYEDADLAVVVKPRGMVVHPAAGHPDGTLVNALLARLDSLGGIGGELRPGIVHRLDKETSGLMLVAKNDETQEALSRMLKDREIEKHYRALAEGRMKEPEGEIDAPIDRSKRDRKKMAVDPEGRPALTRWKVLAEGPLEGAGGGTCLHTAGRAYPDRPDAPDPGAPEEHRASGLRGRTVRFREGREGALPDAARLQPGLRASPDP